MKENKIFKTAIVRVLLIVIGLIHFTEDMPLSIEIGICIYVIAYFIDQTFKI